MVATNSFSSRFEMSSAEAARDQRSLTTLPFILAAAMLAVSIGPVGSGVGLVILSFASFAFVRRSLAWALVPVLATELTVASYRIPVLGTTQRLTVVVVGILLASAAVLTLFRSHDANFKRVLVPSVALVVVATLVNLMTSGSSYSLKYARYQCVQVLGLVLVAAVIRTRKDLLIVAKAALAIAVGGGIAAVWQHYARYSAPAANLDAALALVGSKGRSIGLSASPVTLGIQLGPILVTLLGYLVCVRWRQGRSRVALIAALIVVLLGLYVSYTRSAELALVPAILAVALCFRDRRRTLLIAFVIVAVVAYEGLHGTGFIGSRYYANSSNSSSTAAHVALWQADLAIAFNSPFIGIGRQNFEAVAASYAGAAGTAVSAGNGALGKERPHNDFLSVWLSWGILALIAYLAIFFGTLKNLLVATRSEDLLVRGIAIGSFGAVVAYGVNSAFHNSMDSSLLLWLYAGFSVSLARLAATKHPRYRRSTLIRQSIWPRKP